MWPDRVSNPGPLTYESGALPTALRGPASLTAQVREMITSRLRLYVCIRQLNTPTHTHYYKTYTGKASTRTKITKNNTTAKAIFAK